ncbi:hypothetical protein Goshw_023724, partial [Gossypium schwendimanii]|nr:hypothetical protein [Gossypium schwendimanii]
MSAGFQVQFLRGFSPLSKRTASDPQCPRCNQAVEDVNHALRFCERHVELAILATRSLQSISSTIVHWSLSPVNVVKVNVDDGFILAHRKVCSEVIIRDEYGQILGACSWLTNQVSTVFAAEALAVACGLRFAYDMGFLLVMLDGDSKLVIDKINDSLEDLSKISALIWEAKEVSKFFRDSRF